MVRTKGTHTYDIFLEYHRCEKCGYIIESRQGYQYRFGKEIKELTCERCTHQFTVIKPTKPTFGPLFG